MNSSDTPRARAYHASLISVASCLLAGYLLQLIYGNFDWSLIRYPVNLFLLTGLLLFIAVLCFRAQSRFFRWLSGIPLSCCNMGAMLLYSLILGLVPQAMSVNEENSVFGFDAITHSWPFILLYSATVINLSCVVARRLLRFSWKSYAFYLNHLGLLICLIAIGLGASGRHSYVMQVEKGTTENRAYNEQEGIMKVPLSIRLTNFRLDEYLPKLVLTDARTGDPIPAGKSSYWQVDTLHTTGKLAGWTVHLTQFLGQAVPSGHGTYSRQPAAGSCAAALVHLENETTGLSKTGWIGCGSFAQQPQSLLLNDTLCLTMTVPEPKVYCSDIVVTTPDGKQVKDRLKVNRPLRSGNWLIYQYGYDASRGKDSTYSRFQLVYDGWLPGIYAGILLFFLGSVCLIMEGKKSKKIKEEKR